MSATTRSKISQLRIRVPPLNLNYEMGSLLRKAFCEFLHSTTGIAQFSQWRQLVKRWTSGGPALPSFILTFTAAGKYGKKSTVETLQREIEELFQDLLQCATSFQGCWKKARPKIDECSTCTMDSSNSSNSSTNSASATTCVGCRPWPATWCRPKSNVCWDAGHSRSATTPEPIPSPKGAQSADAMHFLVACIDCSEGLAYAKHVTVS
jgi:hypothetical protein